MRHASLSQQYSVGVKGLADAWDAGQLLIVVDIEDNTVNFRTLRFSSLQRTIINMHSRHVVHDDPDCILIMHSLQFRPPRIYSCTPFGHLVSLGWRINFASL